MTSLQVDFEETISCLHAIPDFVTAATIGGAVYVMRHPAAEGRHLSSDIVETHTLPGREGITAGCVVDKNAMLYGDASGKVHLLHPLRQHGKPVCSVANTDPDLMHHVQHITASVANGDVTAVTDSNGIVRIYSTRDMSHRMTLPGRFPIGVAGAGDHSIIAPTGGNALSVFDVRNSKYSVFSMYIDDAITCVAEATPTRLDTGVMGTAGGRCCVLRLQEGAGVTQRCFLPAVGTERHDITSVSLSVYGSIISADSVGNIAVVDSATAHIAFRERLENCSGPSNVVGAQMISETVFMAAKVSGMRSTLRFVRMPTPSTR